MANGFKKENLLTPESEKVWKEWLKTSRYEPAINVENQLNKKSEKELAPMPGNHENHDTIGMIALDNAGNLSGACTTSGLAFKMHGRVGDSPIIGAGLYVDNEVGAATGTGLGEEVIRCVGSHLIVEKMRQGILPEVACKMAVERIMKLNPQKARGIQIGFLALNKKGQFGAYALQKGFSFAVRNRNEDVVLQSKSIY
jgi:N4-(beta-N-acetylglucosaminyl)-L-asparaginase